MSTDEIKAEKQCAIETKVSDHLESNEEEQVLQSSISKNDAGITPIRNLGKRAASTIWKTIAKPIIGNAVSRAIPWSPKTHFLQGVSKYGSQFSFAISNFLTTKTLNLSGTDVDFKKEADQNNEDEEDTTIKENDLNQNAKERDGLDELMDGSLSGERSSRESHPINVVMETECDAEEGVGKADGDESTVQVREELDMQSENADELCCNKLENEYDLYEVVPDKTGEEHDVNTSLMWKEIKDENYENSHTHTIGQECREVSLMEAECQAQLDYGNADIDESATYSGSDEQNSQPENASQKFCFPRDAIASKAQSLVNVPLSALCVSPPLTTLDFKRRSEITTDNAKSVVRDLCRCEIDEMKIEVTKVAASHNVLENSSEGYGPVSISTQCHNHGRKRRKTVRHRKQTPSVTGEAVIKESEKRNTKEDAGTGAVPLTPWNESSTFFSNQKKQQSLAGSKIRLDLIDPYDQDNMGLKDKKYPVIQCSSQPTSDFNSNEKGSNEKKTGLVTVDENIHCIRAETEECKTTGPVSENKSHLPREECLGVASSQISNKLDSNDQCEKSIAYAMKESSDDQVSSRPKYTEEHEDEVKHEESSQLSDLATYSKETSISQDALLLLNFSASRKKKIVLNWTPVEDTIIFEAVITSAKVPFRSWTALAQRLPGRNAQQVRNRWNNQLNPKINRSPFSREDDMRLWNGHKTLGSQWLKISVEHFDSTRSRDQLLYRWKHPLFKEFIKDEFGPDAYEIRNSKGGIYDASSCHGTRVPKKTDESSISTSKAYHENPGAIPLSTSAHNHAKYVPFSNEDNFRLWEAYNTLGAQWARISVHHFNSTRAWYQLKYQMQCSSFQELVRSRFGSDVFECGYRKEGVGNVSCVQTNAIKTAPSSYKIADVDEYSKREHHRAHLSIQCQSYKPVDCDNKGDVALPARVKRKLDHVVDLGIQPKQSDEVNLTNDLLLSKPNKMKRLKGDKKRSHPGNNTYRQAAQNQRTKGGRKFAGTEAGHSFTFEASSHGVNIKSVDNTGKAQFKLQVGDLIRRYVDDGDDDEYPLLGVVLNFNVSTGKYTIRYRNSTSELLTENELEEKVLLTVPKIDDGEKADRCTPLHIVSGKTHLVRRIADDSMDRLGNDILHHIASFLPSVASLISFCSTSKQANLLLRNTLHSEKLFCRLFAKKFGDDRGASEHFRHMSWKDRWRTVACFRKGFNRLSGLQSKSTCTLSPRTVGVLPQETEESAILYDNPQFDSPESETSHGYFGMRILHNLPKPPNATEWEAPLIVHGDFNGVKIFSSVGDLIRVSDFADRDRFLSLGDGYGCQVLSLILSPSELIVTHDRNVKVAGPPCCFIGYASGRVGGLCAKLTEDGMSYTFALSSGHAHSCEVTCLAIVNCRSNSDKCRPILFSACCGGKVYYYPHALEENHRMDSELAFSNVKHCPIFSMVPIEIDSIESNFSNILCTGDRSGTISLWSMKKDVDINGPALNNIFSRVGTFKGGRGNHPVTAAKVIRGDILVTGNTNGDLRFWNFECAHTPKKGLHPRLNLQQYHHGVHTGAVEVCMSVGDVLLTSGGNDGKLVGWDLNLLSKIGNLQCHPGKKISPPGGRGRRVMNSCVISAILPTTGERRLICLCRDGVLVYWPF